MKLTTYIDRINKMHKMLSSEKTGTPKQLATKLGICESRLYCIVDDLKLQNVPIAYCRKRESYYYTRPFKIAASLLLQDLTEEETKNISGGCTHYFFCRVGQNSFVPSMAVGAGDDTNLPKKEWF
jgi:predicted DNA-binding transcriptional regulator YafY